MRPFFRDVAYVKEEEDMLHKVKVGMCHLMAASDDVSCCRWALWAGR